MFLCFDLDPFIQESVAHQFGLALLTALVILVTMVTTEQGSQLLPLIYTSGDLAPGN